MQANYRSFTPDQPILFPALMADSLQENHLVFFVRDIIGKLDLSEIHDVYRNRMAGALPYNPEMMVGLLLYGYCTGITSSRKLEIATHEMIPFKVLTADQQPDHDSIASFRARHLPALSKLFYQSLELCQKTGLVKFGHIALDGTKIKANASKHKAMSYGRMEKKAEELRSQIEELLKKAESDDALEDSQYGHGVSGNELPKELARRESRLAKINVAMRELEAEAEAKAKAAEKAQENFKAKSGIDGSGSGQSDEVQPPRPEDKAQRNFTDPESRIMKDGATKEFTYCYNAQAAVDSEKQVIVAACLTQSANDFAQAVPMVSAIKRNAGGVVIGAVSMDAGYASESNISQLENGGIDLYASPGSERKSVADKSGDDQEDVAETTEAIAADLVCVPAEVSVKSKRNIHREKMRAKLLTAAGRAVYKMRKAVVEPVFGQIKSCRGFRRFSFRGFEKTGYEWSFVCAVHNFLKLFTSGKYGKNCLNLAVNTTVAE
jgi:transposase